jgi:phosphoenolpyruvate carboxykinase (ATP)
VPTRVDPVFGLHVPESVPGVPAEILNPRQTWSSASDYDQAAQKLAGLFVENFKKYADEVDPEVLSAQPKL